MPDIEANKAVVSRFFDEVWNQGDLEVLNELFAPDAVNHGPHDPFPELRGPENARQTVSTYRTAFPDTHFTVEDVVAEGDLVVSRWSAEGTHKGEIMGFEPTGQRATVRGISMARMKNGRITEGWNLWDALGLLEQLGLDLGIA